MPSEDSDASAADLTETELYDAVYHAVHNALWDVLGTVVLTALLLVVFATGLQILRNSTAAAAGTQLPAAVLGVLVAAAAALGLLRLYDYL